ncbi:MAG: hypothetical protein ACOCQG_01125 [Candidatus Nanoarchaeia archaeon]
MVQVKKAMMYSIITVMLLLMVVLLSFAYVQRDALFSDLTGDSFISIKFSRIQSTIATDYLDIMGIEIESLSSEKMEMNHSFKLSEKDPLPSRLLTEYISYFENYYAQGNNLYAELGLESFFYIHPFSYSITRTNHTYLSGLGGQVEKIDVVAKISENGTYFNDNETIIDYEKGSTGLNIRLYDNSSRELFKFYDEINLTGTNMFSFQFNPTEPEPGFLIEVEDEDLYIEAFNNLNASVSLFYKFNSSGSKIYLNTGVPTRLESKQKDFSKEGPITLMTG